MILITVFLGIIMELEDFYIIAIIKDLKRWFLMDFEGFLDTNWI